MLKPFILGVSSLAYSKQFKHCKLWLALLGMCKSSCDHMQAHVCPLLACSLQMHSVATPAPFPNLPAICLTQKSPPTLFKTCLSPPSSVCIVASKGTRHPCAPLLNLATLNVPSSWCGSSPISRPWMASSSACTLMSGALASLTPLRDMAHTLAPSVATHIMEPGAALRTDLPKVLYILPTPYKPTTWKLTLFHANLQPCFPNLIHDLTYGSPIGNPPPLSSNLHHPPTCTLKLLIRKYGLKFQWVECLAPSQSLKLLVF